tara:strand:- start:16259 stop:16486 length:228 start_codon:yes stop_codon:yes gene_type:complete
MKHIKQTLTRVCVEPQSLPTPGVEQCGMPALGCSHPGQVFGLQVEVLGEDSIDMSVFSPLSKYRFWQGFKPSSVA